MVDDTDDPEYDYERLRKILETKTGRPVTIEEATRVGDQLLDYYTVIHDVEDKRERLLESIDKALSGEFISLAHVRKGGRGSIRRACTSRPTRVTIYSTRISNRS